ncbi:MAG TPA: hypothetical protein PKZ75_15010 [Bacteroidia bacterium]|nr:hypothetical protein [Bacteroidia bacterium]
MILIRKNTTNRNILTLSEKTTLINAVYLFEVKNQQSDVVKCFISQDISINKLRANEFDLIENTTENLLNGIFSLPLNGSYTYKVYEQSSSTNLDPLLALNEIDNGKLLVVDTENEITQYTGNQTTAVVYKG